MVKVRYLTILVSLAAAALLATKVLTQEKPMNDNATRVVSVALLQPAAELLAQSPMSHYQEELRGPDGRDSASLYLTEHASGGNLDSTATGGPLVFRYAAKECAIELPAGRQLMASIQGPVVGRASTIFPMEPMTWDEMQSMVSRIVALFDDSGWTRVKFGRQAWDTIELDDFTTDTGPKWAPVGQWQECNGGPGEAIVAVKHYNSLTGSSFTPPVALSKPLPDDAPDRFLMSITFGPSSQELRNRLGDLVMARRAAEGIDPALQKLPASIWLDEPDWRPKGWSGGF